MKRAPMCVGLAPPVVGVCPAADMKGGPLTPHPAAQLGSKTPRPCRRRHSESRDANCQGLFGRSTLQTRWVHACFLTPGPPYLGLSRQLWHLPQSSVSAQPVQTPQR
eukprot:scaffold268452_cov36-Tisochrysis_lutea.AAC.2